MTNCVAHKSCHCPSYIDRPTLAFQVISKAHQSSAHCQASTSVECARNAELVRVSDKKTANKLGRSVVCGASGVQNTFHDKSSFGKSRAFRRALWCAIKRTLLEPPKIGLRRYYVLEWSGASDNSSISTWHNVVKLVEHSSFRPLIESSI